MDDNKICFYYDLPVLYVSTRGSAAVTNNTGDLNALRKYTEDDERFFSDPLVCNPEAVLNLAYTYGYKDGKDTTVLKNIYNEARVYKYGKAWKPSDIVKASTKYYLGLVSEYNDFYSNCFGNFTMRAIKGNGSLPVYIFPDSWSINKASSDEKIKSAQFLLYYLINTNEGQRAVSCSSGNAHYIPFRNDLTDEIIKIDGEYENILKAAYKLPSTAADFYAFEYKKSNKLESLARDSKSTSTAFNKIASEKY